MNNKIKILIVDDDTDLLYLLTSKLKKGNIECSTATQPGEGLQKAIQSPPDLVLLDLNLPKMSGFGFLREFKHHSELNKIPVVVLSAIEDQEISEEAKSLGAVGYLTKKCSDKELLSVIHRYTGHVSVH